MSIFSNGSVHISAKTDYAIRATIELAAAGSTGSLTAHAIADAQQIPLRFLLNILADLRRMGLVDSRRGPSGGWWLSRSADTITIAEVIRAVDGPMVEVGGRRPDESVARGAAESVNHLWLTVRDGIRGILEQITVADLAAQQAAPPAGPPAPATETPLPTPVARSC
jgi:Rrf2 family protein